MHFDTDGVYTLQYTATDSCGNETIEEREVIVGSPRTVLYTDGTLIINEKPKDMAGNIALHGAATNTYKWWSTDISDPSTSEYRFSSASQVLWYAQRNSIIHVEVGSAISPVYLDYWFTALQLCESIDVSLLDTSKAVSMASMFSNCRILTTLDVSNFDTAKVTSMKNMFLDCRALTTLDVSNFDTAEVTDMSSMFYRMRECITLDVSNFDTSKVTDMSSMFSDMIKLESVNVSGFDTNVVTSMQNMFYGTKLTSLDLGDFDTSAVTNMNAMFSHCTSLQTIYVSNSFNTSSLTDGDNMFSNCNALVGGAGTTWSALNVGSEYAHIDGGTSNPGYFTAKA